MKKYIIIPITIALIIPLFVFVYINFQKINDILSQEQTKITIKDYFPIKQNIKYIYEVVDEEVFYEVTSDYTSKDAVQLRIKDSSKGNKEVTVSLISVKDDKATNISMQENLFRENILMSSKYLNENIKEDILLMEPLITGTKWYASDNSSREITNTELKIDTPIGTYETIEVTTESANKKTVDYYAKNIGLIKSVTTSENNTITVVIKEIHNNIALAESIEFFYPDLNAMKILKKVQNVVFSTNDNTETVLTSAYKNALSKGYSVLNKNAKINSITLKSDKTLHVDLNKSFIDDIKRKALMEGMVLQSITNTFGRFYDTEQVVFSIDNEDYSSNNIKLNHRPFAVNYIDFPLFYDVVIYGGTASGVMAAVSAARDGMDVALIEPGRHIGGMVTGGLSYTDRGDISIIGGITKEVFKKIGSYYGKDIEWNFEPHIAEKAFVELLKNENVDLYFNKMLKEKNGIEKHNKKIINIETEDGALFFGQIFIDSSYEGDLMADSGVSYTVGRESSSQYDESFAGELPPMGRNNFYYHLNAFDDYGSLYYGVSDGLPGIIGQGDKKVQAYNYRLCVTNQENMIPFYKPNNYNRNNYELLSAWINKIKELENRELGFSDIVYLGKLPNNKYDVNNYGPFSTDFIGESWEYPDGDYKKREEIKNNHKEYIQGLLYFISNDESIPEELKRDVKKWGYAADEFTDNHYWPYQIYIREARRMISDFVFTESDIRKDKVKYDSVGIGSYGIDTHNVQRYIIKEGFVLNEGELQFPVKPYEIPYRALIPKKSETENLIVSVCISASHSAYSSVRMEPQYMIMGEAAGIAAAISIRNNNNVQEIDYDELKTKLINNGSILKLKAD